MGGVTLLLITVGVTQSDSEKGSLTLAIGVFSGVVGIVQLSLDNHIYFSHTAIGVS